MVAALQAPPNVYVETSLIGVPTLESVIAALGPGRVVFGSDVPESSLSVELAKVASPDLDEAARHLPPSAANNWALGGCARVWKLGIDSGADGCYCVRTNIA